MTRYISKAELDVLSAAVGTTNPVASGPYAGLWVGEITYKIDDEDRNVVWVQIIRYTLPLGVLAEYTEVETFTAVVKDEEPQP